MNIFEAVKEGNQEVVEQLVESDSSLVDAVSPEGIRPVLVAIYYGHKELAEYLRRHSSHLNIWEAAALGDLPAVRSAVEQDPSLLDALAPDGFTPLGLTAFFGQLPVLEWLLGQGGDPNIAARNPMAVYPIHSAAANRNPETAITAVRLLVAHGAQVNVAQRGGWTPLHQAADHGNQRLVELLLEAGADRQAKSSDGRTPAQMAAEKGFHQTAETLG